jgi:hypothetical protein
MSLTFFLRASRFLVLVWAVAGCATNQDLPAIEADAGATADRPSADGARSGDAAVDGNRGAAEATPAPAPLDGAINPGPAQCQRDEDCQLVNDCCSCQAIGARESAPYCDPKMACVMPSCSQYGGLDHAKCMAGRCVLGFDCDASNVACKRLPPVCPAGQAPQIVGQGASRCYGECVDARQCLSVPSCSVCAAKDLCVKYILPMQVQAVHCVPTPTNCAANPTCACVQSAVCVGAYQMCTGYNSAPTIQCSCMNCM